eukprot:g26672.t1
MSESNQSPTAPPPNLVGSPPLQGERVALTGTLASMTHQQALDLVEKHGGTGMTHVSSKTSMLVVGEEGWPLEADGQPSQKLKQVNEWNAAGGECRILKESEWLFLIGLEERRREIHGEHTPAMLSRLLNVPVNDIRNWARVGLIRPVRTVGRLPFFDFQEVSSARRIAELLTDGVSDRELKIALQTLKTMLPGIERPLSQLQILARDSRLLYRDEYGLVEPLSRQRRFDFELDAEEGPDDQSDRNDAVPDSPDTLRFERPEFSGDAHSENRSPAEWAQEGSRRLDANDPESAAECFRMSLMERPGDAETQFCLGEALYRMNEPTAALERYYAAVECEHDYLEALMQIGVVCTELGKTAAALDAFDLALAVHADYPDAHWQKADLLWSLGRNNEALPHWRAYLLHDSRSDVQVLLAGRDVALFGDAGDNEIAIEQMNNWVIVRGLNGTTVNGMNEYLISGLPFLQDDFLIQLGDGNDVVIFADGIQVSDDLRIDTGAGNDVVRLSNNRIVDDLIIDTGTGDDTILVSNCDILDDYGIFAGAGNNTVSVVDTRTSDDFVLHANNGNDTVTLLGNTTAGSSNVETHGGNDTTEVLPTNDGRALPGADALNQFIAPDAVDDFYDAIDMQIVVDAAGGVAANDFRSGIGGTTTITLESGPEHGTLTLNQDGSFTYTVDGDFAGSDSFSYRLTNSFGGFDVAEVTLTTLEIPLTLDGTQNRLVESEGTFITQDDTLVLHGTTTAGATVEVDVDGDGEFDDGTAVADADGLFMVTVTLIHDDDNHGENAIDVRSTLANSGRQQTESINIHYALGTVVSFETSLGSFDVELFDDMVPETVANFISYFESYTNSIVDNIIPGVAIQGGMYVIDATGDANISEIATNPPIDNQFDMNNLNLEGTLSMIHPDGNVDGATSAWMINLADNPDFDTAMNTVFGRVIGTGMTIVNEIAMLDTFNLSGVVPGMNLPDVPLEDYVEFQDESTGLVSITAGTNTVNGNTTSFLTDLQPTVNGIAGSVVQINSQVYVVGDIISDTEMTLLDPTTLDPAQFSSDINNAILFFNEAPDPGDYFEFFGISDLFHSIAVDDEYESFDGELNVDANNGLLSNDLLASGAANTTASLQTQAANGTVEINPDGSFTYTPDSGFEGLDSFEYLITNTFGFTDVGTVQINTIDFDLTATADTSSGDVVQSQGTFVTEVNMVTITGNTESGATIDIDSDGDGQFDDGTIVADAQGDYSIDVTLTHNNSNLGANAINVRSTLTGTGFQRSTVVNVHYAVGTVVHFNSSVGEFDVELFDTDAPNTVANFMSYFNQYVNSIVHRSAKTTLGGDFVVQGGGFIYDAGDDPVVQSVTKSAPVNNEFMSKNSNVRGTLSMAQLSGDINSGTSEWFFNLVNNAFLDTIPHTVFGRVIGTGMDVVDAIADLPSINLNGVFPETALGTTPLENYTKFEDAISGTVSVAAGSSTVTGVGTSFTTELTASIGQIPGSSIEIDGEEFVVGEILSDTQLTLKSVTSPTIDGVHMNGATDVQAFVNSVPDEANFVVFESIDELFGP